MEERSRCYHARLTLVIVSPGQIANMHYPPREDTTPIVSPLLKRFRSSAGRFRTCGRGCVTVSHESRAPARVATHGSPQRNDTN
jgi:hypothetical protein